MLRLVCTCEQLSAGRSRKPQVENGKVLFGRFPQTIAIGKDLASEGLELHSF
jgi:hypothetical protein